MDTSREFLFIILHIRICIGVVHKSISLKTRPCNGSLVQTKEIWTGSQNIKNKCAQEQNGVPSQHLHPIPWPLTVTLFQPHDPHRVQ